MNEVDLFRRLLYGSLAAVLLGLTSIALGLWLTLRRRDWAPVRIGADEAMRRAARHTVGR